MRAFLQRQAREIASDPALRIYGAALCVGHFLAFVLWRQTGLPKLLGQTIMPVCWPFWENCAELPRLSTRFWQLSTDVYALLAIFSGVWFLRGKTNRALVLYALVFCCHLAILFQDYRLRLNQHTMLMWVGLAFLLAPSKRFTLRALVVSFYVFAGLLKLDREWLSGNALGGHLPLLVPQALLPVACAYVLLLELVLIWGLFSRNRWLFWGTLAQLGLFHLTSYSVVGFFYPLLMVALLSIFVLDRYVPNGNPEPARFKHAALVVVPFGLLQLLPLTISGDSAMTGQGRFLALHMFDAKLSCTATATLYYSDRPPQANAMRASLPDRIACDPLVYFHFARAVCKSNRGKGNFEDLDLELVTKRRGGPSVRVIDQPRFCTKPVHYSAFSANSWIHGR